MSIYPTPLEIFYHWEKDFAQRVFLRQPVPGKGYQDYTYQECGRQIRAMAAFLKEKNLPAGSHIGILSKNCAHWILSDLAIWMSGHVSVPLYPNLTEQAIREILNHSDCRLAFIGKLDDVLLYRRAVPKEIPCIAFPYHDVPEAKTWEQIVAGTAPLSESPSRSLDELATLIYTSGTTGEPKGVMHSFRSFAVAGVEISKTVGVVNGDRFFSYLPLAHVAERLLVETCGLYGGGSIAFAESLETFQKNLQTVEPTIFLSVPRLWQKFQAGILAKVPQAKLDLLLKVPILSGIIKRKLRTALGLNAARLVVTGSAPTPPALIEWFKKIGLTLQEAYGMSENFAYSHFNLPGKIQVGTVGTPWPLVEARISEEGEIQVASPCDYLGYYKDKKGRTEYFDGKYFRTGDRGEISPTGHLKITGRVKELFKTSKGKYIAPAPIEMKLLQCTRLEAVCVVGANFPSPFAIAMPNPLNGDLPKAALENEIATHLERVNSGLNPHERLSRIVLVKEAWTIDGGFITPTLKVKRAFLEKFYEKQIPLWEKRKETVLWGE